MKRSKLVPLATLWALGSIAACSGGLVVEDEPKADADTPASSTVNTNDCPSDPPDSGGACGPEGTTCSYRYDDPTETGAQIYTECACWLAQDGTPKWDCYENDDGPPCPASLPEELSNCFGMIGQTCHYPALTWCSCMPGGEWACNPPNLDESRPAGVDPTTPVNELDDGARHAWCGWYLDTVRGAGYPEPIDEIDANGYVKDPPCYLDDRQECDASVPVISTADCVANLALSSCGAAVDTLSDCVATLMNGCVPTPHGCAPYLNSPGCSGTIATTNVLPSGAEPIGEILFPPEYRQNSDGCAPVEVR
ncbi:MAG TPA: hypothetical protein VMI54_29840 [Polyangiaceae bacterium]|nr:hypothetical protein [Polyangiaceae bacterium]